MKNIGSINGGSNVKRLYLNGVTIKGYCPGCKKRVQINLNKNDGYFGFNYINEPFEHELRCPDCNMGWSVKLQLTVSLNIIEAQSDENNPY